MNDRNGIKFNENERKLYEENTFFVLSPFFKKTEWIYEIDARNDKKMIQNQVIDTKSHANALLSLDEHTQKKHYIHLLETD